MKYLVIASHGPGFTSAKQNVEVLQKGILPLFNELMKLEKKKIINGGLPVGERTLAFILEAPSNDAADRLLREFTAWGALDWKVTPLQTFKARAQEDRQDLAKFKKMLK